MMKLNNRGFAITVVLYGLLILFVLLTGSYLSILGAKKNRLDVITRDIEERYAFEKEYAVSSITINDDRSFEAPCVGKYDFDNGKSVYLYKGKTYEIEALVNNKNANITKVYCQGSGSNEKIE